MFIEISLFIFGFLTILFGLLTMYFFVKSERLSQDLAIQNSILCINRFSLDEILSNSNVTSAYVNELLTKVNCAIGKHEEAKTKISELQEEIRYLVVAEINLNSYLQAEVNEYATKQALLPDMQSDSVTMFNLIDYLRKYSDVFTASELLDEWYRFQDERAFNEQSYYDSLNLTNTQN